MKSYQFTPSEAGAFIGCLLILPFFALAIMFVAMREIVRPSA